MQDWRITRSMHYPIPDQVSSRLDVAQLEPLIGG